MPDLSNFYRRRRRKKATQSVTLLDVLCVRKDFKTRKTGKREVLPVSGILHAVFFFLPVFPISENGASI